MWRWWGERERRGGESLPAGVDDGVVGHAGCLEGRAEERHVLLLVLRLVVLGIGGAGELSRSQVTANTLVV